MKCPHCRKSLWFVRTFCPFCKTSIIVPRRPNSVTLIARLLLAFGAGMTLLQGIHFTSEGASEFRRHYPYSAVHIIAGSLVALVSGACMLRGANWARWLFAAWFGYTAASQIVTAVRRNMGINPIAPLLIGTAAYFLWRPAATAFFRDPPVLAPDSQHDGRPVCVECGVALPSEDMIRIGNVYSCARCKPLFVQRMLEGTITDTEPPQR